MARKLFIVAHGNAVVYRQLQNTVGRDPDVEIIYDRRPARRKPSAVDRLVRLVPRRPTTNILEQLDRRQQKTVEDELAKKGFVVIHVEEPEQRTSLSRGEPTSRLVVEPGDARLGTPPAASRAEEQKDLEEKEGSVS
jgi:hypothetical protein